MTGDGTLAAEIQRKAAEIESWPDWAKPYGHKTPSTSPANDQTSTPSDHNPNETDPSMENRNDGH
jgi:hypothetical protein